nr:transposase, MuDR, MULE transposase domain protein [Tanacetum cinerariifolium]
MFFNFLESTTLENKGPSNSEIPSSHFNEPHFSNSESSFDFRSNEYNTEDVVNENPKNKIHKWQKFMSFKPDIPDTPVYKAKPNISKQYSQQSEVQKGWLLDSYVPQLSTPGAYDRCCAFKGSIQGNKSGLKNKKRKGLFWKICKAYTREDYATNMNTLQIVQPDAHEKLCRDGPRRWSRAHCPLVRYNYMTSNSVESVNACSVIYRKEPVLKLAETYRAMVQEWYYKRRQLAANMTYEITDWAANKVEKKRMKSATWVVNGVNAYQYEYDAQHLDDINTNGSHSWFNSFEF